MQFIVKYKEEVTTAIRAVVKQLVFEALADNDFDSDGPYTVEKVQLLNFNEWIELVNRITTNLLRFLKRTRVSAVQTSTVGIDHVHSF